MHEMLSVCVRKTQVCVSSWKMCRLSCWVVMLRKDNNCWDETITTTRLCWTWHTTRSTHSHGLIVVTLLLRPGTGAEYCDRVVCLSVCLSVHKHVSGTAGAIFPKCFVQIPCDRGLVLFWRLCDTLCTSGFMGDVTFGCSVSYGNAWKAEPLTYCHWRRCDTEAESDVYECVVCGWGQCNN